MTDIPLQSSTKHSLIDDALGILTGAVLMALTVHLMQAGSLIAGQIAGLSLVGSYLTPWSFGAVFFVLNLPFYILALRQLGWLFTLKTFVAVALLSGFTELMPLVFVIDTIHPGAAAVISGITGGAGLLVLIRHGASLGGIGIVAIYMQDRYGIKAGMIQQGFDVLVFASAFFIFSTEMVAWSLLGAVILNAIILLNHRRDRYIAR